MKKYIPIISISVLVLASGAFFVLQNKTVQQPLVQVPVTTSVPTKPLQTPIVPSIPVVPVGVVPTEDQTYYGYTMKTSNAQKELSGLVGEDNILLVLKVNRIDLATIKLGSKIVIPKIFDMQSLSPFPINFVDAISIPKLLVISQHMQVFGVYENGILIRWGAVSSGKKSTPTMSKLYSTNWKGKEVRSSFSDEWILKYNFNIDNANGIGFHQYQMPGYPASHSCVRLLLEDAMWLYDWADQWIVTPSGNTQLAHGTPVIVFGAYEFGKTAPWKMLSENAHATDVSIDELNTELGRYKDTINEWQVERTLIVGSD